MQKFPIKGMRIGRHQTNTTHESKTDRRENEIMHAWMLHIVPVTTLRGNRELQVTLTMAAMYYKLSWIWCESCCITSYVLLPSYGI